MTPEQFCYWLQGFIELNEKPPTAAQWKSINEHLGRVFKKETPPVDGSLAERTRTEKPIAFSKEQLKDIENELRRHPPIRTTLIC